MEPVIAKGKTEFFDKLKEHLANGGEVRGMTPVAIETTSSSFIFHYAKDDREWAMELSSDANFAFAQLTKHEPKSLAEINDVAILELRKYGVLELTPTGEIAEPVTLSELGVQVSKIMGEIQFEPMGTCRQLAP